MIFRLHAALSPPVDSQQQEENEKSSFHSPLFVILLTSTSNYPLFAILLTSTSRFGGAVVATYFLGFKDRQKYSWMR
jgi:hypothetical protein